MCKKICVIGNGATALNGRDGDFIDSCDMVFRMGAFELGNFTPYVGSKMTHYASGIVPLKFWDNIRSRKNKSAFVWCFIPSDSLSYSLVLTNYELEYIHKWYHTVYEISNCNRRVHLSKLNSLTSLDLVLSWDSVIKLIRDMSFESSNVMLNSMGYQLRPSLGLFVLNEVLIRYPEDLIYIKGFDSFKTRWYWGNDGKRIDKHFPLLEKIYLLSLASKKRIFILGDN